MSKREITKLRRLGAKRIDVIDSVLANLENNIKESQKGLLKSVISEVVDKFDIDDKKVIRATANNMRLLSNFNQVFSEFAQTYGVSLSKEVYKGLTKVTNFNKTYFLAINPNNTTINKIDKRVKNFINAWLGLDKSGGVVKNGYLHKIIESDEVRLEVQTLMANSIVGRKGWMETKQNLYDKIIGTNEKQTNGALSKYYRNFVYDTFAAVDRASSDVYRSDLNLVFAIYEGGIIKTTRPFCREHNGKVYHITEIEAFEPKSGIPTDGTYNPLIDAGGFNCRHYYNWITEAFALTLRPDVINFIE